MQPSDGGSGPTCVLCGKPFKPGQRILWRVMSVEEEFGWTATHLLCPRTVGLLLVLGSVVFSVVAVALALLLPL